MLSKTANITKKTSEQSIEENVTNKT